MRRSASGRVGPVLNSDLFVRLSLENLAATVKAGGADVVTQVGFARGGFHRNAGNNQRIVRAVHAALGGGLFVLLNCHDLILLE